MATENKRVQRLLTGGLTAEQRSQLISTMWEDSPEHFPQIVAILASQLDEIKDKVKELMKPPLSVGMVLRTFDLSTGAAVQVTDPKGNLSIVSTFVEVSPGDTVAINSAGVIVERFDLVPTGETVSTFDTVGDNQPVVVDQSGSRVSVEVGHCSPKPGDLVSVRGHTVRRVIGKPRTSRFNFESNIDTGFTSVGGLDDLIQEIKTDLDLHLAHPDIMKKFGLRPMHGMVLTGPPGNGKTMLAKGIASYLKTTYPDVRFLNVKPGALRACLYGQTESNIRELFSEARACQFAVIFFDELDNFGSRSTNTPGTEIDSRVLATLLAEIDGLALDSGNVLCVAATNRLDLCDPALVREGRLGDRIYTIPRPNREGVRSITSIYLTDTLPYHQCSIEDCVAAAMDTMFPDKPPVLAEAHTRDGQVIGLEPGDLVSGSLIATGIEKAKHMAAARALTRSRRVGLTTEDVHLGLLHSINTEAEKIIGRPEIARATLSAPWVDKITAVNAPNDATAEETPINE